MIHLDTHVLVWLYAGDRERLGRDAVAVLDEEDLVASPMALLEMDLLHEIGRLTTSGKEIAETLTVQTGLRISATPFLQVVESAALLAWTRDPFDRLIVANAIADGARLVTKNLTIREHFDGALWEPPPKKRRQR